jgi:hypothetical protein
MINSIQEEPLLSPQFRTSVMALPELITWIWNLFRKIVKIFSKKGMYEVLDFQTKLTLHDPEGEKEQP